MRQRFHHCYSDNAGMQGGEAVPRRPMSPVVSEPGWGPFDHLRLKYIRLLDRPCRLRRIWQTQRTCILDLYMHIREDYDVCTIAKTGSELFLGHQGVGQAVHLGLCFLLHC